ncbi:hypothetical protein A33Q_2522 [Indibacter alkaliphilus LW1]|uniref:Uncharacterized protein n=1 Tax=Indibacter alkaliphilus (strain CCUG 57479 / KCTC 22604 / LW1) TaxID=1189612 RepID=S2DAI9_INDAL|nr:hypothetical protein A33Q_2522 [Indibacter alkaliphilus LW1]
MRISKPCKGVNIIAQGFNPGFRNLTMIFVFGRGMVKSE